MGELLAVSQSSLLLLPRFQLGVTNRRQVSIGRIQASLSENSCMQICSTKLVTIPTIYAQQKQFSRGMRVHVVSDSKMPTTFTVDSAGEGIDVLPDSGGSNDDLGGPKGNGGGGGGGNNGGNDNEHSEGSGESDDHKKRSDKKAEGTFNVPKIDTRFCYPDRSWWNYGLFEDWKPEVADCRWGISLAIVLCLYNASY
ncbi:protein FATTY ACID EXPORT 2 [Abeliophyllum distichum]|uniref:Protein FATTY ACID EXPORT 2 n=1 Tax=Abeliophyllum distichum TaxID=126358 RepID=A0ABD1SAJ3_9LAMI